MKRSLLTGTILGAFAIAAASASLLASQAGPKPSPASPTGANVEATARPSAGSVVEAARPPVPLVRPPKGESSTSAAAIEEPSPPPAPTRVEQADATAWMPPSIPAFAQSGGDQRYWIVPLDGQRVMVVSWDRGRKGDKREKHRRRGRD